MTTPNTYGMTGVSPAMQLVYDRISRIKGSDITVLITGESGTGKDLVARALRNPNRRKGQYLAVNVTQFSPSLLESELFGHVRGAYTGSTGSREGLFAEANHGTLFLDEISEMPLAMQVKLLRVLEDGYVSPVGGRISDGKQVNFQLIAASSKPLRKAVAEGKFRPDLYHRLNQISIALPALRDREADVCLLAQHFVIKHSEKPEFRGKEHSIAKMTYAWLASQHWSGNVRQLGNLTYRAMVLSDGELRPEHYEMEGAVPTGGEFSLSWEDLLSDKNNGASNYLRDRLCARLRTFDGQQSKAAESLGTSVSNLGHRLETLGVKPASKYHKHDSGEPDLPGELKTIVDESQSKKKSFLRRVLGVHIIANGGNKSAAARDLGCERSKFYHGLTRIGLPMVYTVP